MDSSLSMLPELKQPYSLIGYSHLTLQETGLRIEEKRFFKRSDILISYEELLPVGIGRYHTFPFRLTLAALFIGFGCLKATYTIVAQPTQRESAMWLLLILTELLLGVSSYALQLWRHDFLITTASGNIAVFDSTRNQEAIVSFVSSIRAHTTQYLIKQYAKIDPLLPVEPQLARLEWLRSMGALNDNEFHKLKTRLIGRFYGSDNMLGTEYGLAPSAN
ncbi:hypothetical protein [Hymenobacter tenuis]